VIPVVPPDWKRVMTLGTDILARSKDIRIGVPICWALLHREGFPGLASGLTLIHRLVADYWDSVHPQLDPEENDNIIERMNALLDLCNQEAMWCRCAWLPSYAPGRSAP